MPFKRQLPVSPTLQPSALTLPPPTTLRRLAIPRSAIGRITRAAMANIAIGATATLAALQTVAEIAFSSIPLAHGVAANHRNVTPAQAPIAPCAANE